MTRIPPPVTIRPARVDDAIAIEKIIELSYRGSGGWTTEEHLVVGKRITVEQLIPILMDESTYDNEPIFVTELVTPDEAGNRVVGCIQPSKGISKSAHTPEGTTTPPKELKQPVTEIIPSNNASGKQEITIVPAVPEVIKSPPPDPSSAMMGLFGVLPSYQSKGIGRILVEAALKHIKEEWKCDKCVLWVLDTRPELIAWYEKLGFKWSGEMKPFVAPEQLLKEGNFKVLERIM